MSTHDTQFVIIIVTIIIALLGRLNFIALLWRRGTTKIKARRNMHRQIIMWAMSNVHLGMPRCTSIEFVNDFAKHRVLPQDPSKSR
jgi:hypothetical protein|tara:strand:+ start:317 stop:574 length:258 start_codon:yes stop_codon:yes gene_type:complete